MSGTGASDLASFGELTRTLLRLSWLIIIGAVLGVVVANAITSDVQTVSATARVGLTDEVEWPFYNAARQRVAGVADKLDMAEVLGRDDVPPSFVDIDVSLPPDETFVNIKVTATDVESAIIMADAFALRVVADDSAGPTDDPAAAASLELITDEITDIEQDIAALDRASPGLLEIQAEADARLAILRSQTVARATLAEAILERNEADADILTARSERDRLLRRLSALEVQLDAAEIEVIANPTVAEIELLRSAVATELPGSPLRSRQILGAVTGALVFGLLAWVFDQNLGVVRSTAALRSATGLPVIDARSERGAGQLAVWIERGAARTIGFIGDSSWSGDFLDYLSPMLTSPTTVATPAQALADLQADPDRERLMIPLGEPSNGQWFDRGVGVCGEVVLLVLSGHLRPVALQRLIKDVTVLDSTVNMVVLIESRRSARKTAPTRPRQPPRAA